MRTPFLVPDEVIVDPVTGYALNIPAGYQDPPGWWEDLTLWTHYLNARKAAGIVVESDMFDDQVDDEDDEWDDDDWVKVDMDRNEVTE